MNTAPAVTVVGQSYLVSFNAPQPVSPASVTPTGTVTVSDGSQTCQATLPATSCNLTSTTTGAKNLTATYGGDNDYNASPISAPLAHTVNKADTTATVSNVNPTPSVYGQGYTVTAAVSVNAPGGGTPAGTIAISDGVNSCNIVLPAISCSLPSNAPGLKSLTATYGGNANYNASPASTGVSHTVNQAGAVDIALAPLTTDQRGMMRPVDHASVPNAAGGNGSDIGAFEFQIPTSANVSVAGLVLTSDGQGLAGATVTMTGTDGHVLTAKTSVSGHFAFKEVRAGQTYVVQVVSRRHSFAPQFVTVNSDVTDLTITAQTF